jgi:hypothetical protein
MEKNLGTADRFIRLAIALFIITLLAAGEFTGSLAAVLLLFAVNLIVTGAISFGPIYYMLGVSSRKRQTA